MKRIGPFFLFSLFACSPARADDGSAEAIARAWILSIRTAEFPALSTRTVLPFVYREAWPRKQCQRTVKTEAGLVRWFACVRKHEDLLVEALKWEQENLQVTADSQNLNPAQRKFASQIRTSGTWISADVVGEGVAYSFLILVVHATGTNRVAAVHIEAEFATC